MYTRSMRKTDLMMIGDEKNSPAVPDEDVYNDIPPAVPRIPPMIALTAKIFNERITVKFSRNQYEISEKPTYTSVTTFSNLQITNKEVGSLSDTENRLPVDSVEDDTSSSYDSEEMSPHSESPILDSATDSKPNKVKYECEFCAKTSKSQKRIFKHKKKCHISCQSFNCKWCSKIFTSRTGWDYHVKSVHENCKQFTCTLCTKKFVTRQQLESHCTNKHKHICHFCGTSFSTTVKLRQHKQVHKTYQCEFCDKSFFRGHRLQEHREKAHPDQLQQEEEANEKDQESVHEDSFHEDPPPPPPPPPSPPPHEEFAEKIQQDEEQEEDIKPKMCVYCYELFACQEDLQQHWKLTGENLLICAHCLYYCESRETFNQHLLSHKKEEIFVCTLCSETFSTMDLLEDHVAKHST